MRMEVSRLAREIGGTALGEVELEITELRAIDEAGPDAICPLLAKKMLRRAKMLPGAVLATRELAVFGIESGVGAAIVHETPLLALAELIEIFYPKEVSETGVHRSAVVHHSAVVHPTASIGPNAVVERNVEIGEGSTIGPGAVICAGSRLGRFVVIGPGAVIGSRGFGFVPGPDGPVGMRHVGRVEIEDFVEIGANTCVDKATLGTTFVGRSSKLDNLVQVGHNVRIGQRVLIAGQAGLAGSVAVGDDAMLGGKAGVADHVVIGQRARVAAYSGVTRNVAEDATVAGYPAISRTTWLRAMARLAREQETDGENNGG